MRGRRSGGAWGHALRSSVFSHHVGSPSLAQIAPHSVRLCQCVAGCGGNCAGHAGALAWLLSAYSVRAAGEPSGARRTLRAAAATVTQMVISSSCSGTDPAKVTAPAPIFLNSSVIRSANAIPVCPASR